MAGFVVFLLYLLVGLLVARAVLPDLSPLIRAWIGLSMGLVLLMWLPALAAFAVRFTQTAEHIALFGLALIGLLAAWRMKKRERPVCRLSKDDRSMFIALVCFALPLTILSAYLQHTHTIRDVNGALHVGQATYGDMAMHLSIITSLRGSSLPAEYNFLPGATLGYPFLVDAMSTSLYLFGMPLRWTIILPGVLMSALVFSGFLLFAREITGKTSAAVVAGILLFFNGGLGFFYDIDMYRGSYYSIEEIFTGFYKTPANQPELNLRWSNLVADLLLPQRSFLAGWTVLLPALYFTRSAFVRLEKRMFLLAGLFGAALPLIHSHSFLALGLYSAGAFACMLFKRDGFKSGIGANKLPQASENSPADSFCAKPATLAADPPKRERDGRRRALFIGAGLYLGIVIAGALPQFLIFTLRQAGTEGFMRFHFNWVNNTEYAGMIDFYLWFWLKNVGLPFLLIIFSLLEWKKENRFELIGASLIFIVAELVLFQPLDYDNNKLFYVWYLLMMPSAGALCVSLFKRLSGTRSRYLAAALLMAGSVLSGSLSIAREVVSDYEFLSAREVAAAEFIEENTAIGDVFITGQHHNNFVYTLAGRRIVCGPENFLWTHGIDYGQNKADVLRFYRAPRENLDVIDRYGVDYIVVGPAELYRFEVNVEEIEALFPVVYDSDMVAIYWTGSNR